MKVKKLLSMLLAVMMLVSVLTMGMTVGANNITFSDVNEDMWSYKDIMYVSENGLMNGTGGGKFEPMTSMSRAMLVTVLHRMAGEPQAAYSAPFTDLRSGAYYEKAVAWAYENGIVKGMTATPSARTTRSPGSRW